MTDVVSDSGPNVRAGRYFIVESRMACLQCGVITAVFALSLPAGYESLVVDDDTAEDEDGAWEVSPLAGVLCYVEYVPESVVGRIRDRTLNFRPDLDTGWGQRFWMNHCQHCGEQLEEEELHGEADRPFGPNPSEGLKVVQVHEVREPFEAWVGGESNDVRASDS